jgi:adenylate cyclase
LAVSCFCVNTRRILTNAHDDATVLAFCGIALVQTIREYDLGLATIRRAVDANPNNLEVVVRARIGNIHCGSLDDALTYFRRALRLSPTDPDAFVMLTGSAHAQMILGNCAEALRYSERSLAVNTSFDPTYWMLIAANAQLGRIDEARRWLAKFTALVPGITIARIRNGQPDKGLSRMAAIFDGLRLAGLDEG